MSDDHDNTLLAAWTLAGCDPEEASAIADHARTCSICLDEATARRVVADLLTDVASSPLAPVPAASVEALLGAARSRRRPALPVPPFARPFAAAVSMFDAVLAEADDDALRRPSPVLDWTAGDLVVHVAAGNAQLAAALHLGTALPLAPVTDQVAYTRALLLATESLPVESARAMWQSDVDAIAACLLAEPGRAGQVVEVGGHLMPVADQVVLRGFETWIHARDIGRAAGVTLPRPPGDILRPMADLAARVLDGRPPRATPGTTGAVRLTLTGPGDGSWLITIGPSAAAGRPDAELTVDAADFCLLVADRIDPLDLDTVVLGDVALVEELLALAPTISGP